MKKVIILVVVFLQSFFLYTNALAAFPDVSKNHPNYDAINYIQAENIVKGYENGLFGADDEIKRAEFTKILIGIKKMMAQAKSQESNPNIEDCERNDIFSDQRKDGWENYYICTAFENGLINGYEDGTFKPWESISFAEATKIIVNTFGLEYETTDSWWEGYIYALEAKDAIPSTIDLWSEITRGEMAEIIYRLQNENVHKMSKTYEQLENNTVFEFPLYKNTQYGFQIKFPDSWENYVVKRGETAGLAEARFDFGVQDYWLYSILIYTTKQWDTISNDAIIILDQSPEYIFTFSSSPMRISFPNPVVSSDIVNQAMAPDIVDNFSLISQ